MTSMAFRSQWALSILLAALTLGALACPGRQAGPGSGPSGPAERLDSAILGVAAEIARLEAARSFSGDELSVRAFKGSSSAVRIRATRALGRVGDEAAISALERLVTDNSTEVRRVAVRGLGMAEAKRTEEVLVKRLAAESALEVKRAIALALGQLGGSESLPALVSALANPEVRAAAATALGRFGRRSIALDSAARAALAQAAETSDVATRKAVAFALAREHEPDKRDPDGVMGAVRALAGDADPEVRATAVRAWARRGGSADLLVAGLSDADWRVRVEAARGLSGVARADADADSGPDVGAVGRALAEAVTRDWQQVREQDWRSAHIQLVVAGLPVLGQLAPEPVVVTAIENLYRAAELSITQPPRPKLGEAARLGVSTVHCLAAAALVRLRALDAEAVLRCGDDPDAHGMPLPERRGLWADLLASGFGGTAAERVEHWSKLLLHSDGRVRARAVAVIPKLVADTEIAGATALRERVLTGLRAAFADTAVEVTGSAADALARLHAEKSTAAYADELVSALIERASQPVDNIELALSFMSTVAAMRAQTGTPICQRARNHRNRTMRDQARACLRALTGEDPGPGEPTERPQAPPVEIEEVLGEKLFWKLVTDKGAIRIALYPKEAPWHVSVIASLTKRKFYAGLTWHRVIGNFVAQGGDPAGSGWGGPDFSIPGEPSTLPYVRGTVGIADAGLDTGGSQLFIAHSRLHHLDARYTVIGQVVEGQDVVDALIVGDRIKSAHIIAERHNRE